MITAEDVRTAIANWSEAPNDAEKRTTLRLLKRRLRVLEAAEKEANRPHTLWWTNADPNYDYGYVETKGEALDKYGKGWRLIAVYDDKRFESFQVPRYQSGLRQAHPVGGKEASFLELEAA